jgi:hypothetical protein
VDIKALIEKQRETLGEVKTKRTDVVLGGQLVEVAVSKLSPDEWQQLAADHPPRKTNKSDLNIGYDQFSLPRDYPVSKVTVAGEPIDQETWAEFYTALEAAHRNTVGSLIWAVNIYDVMQELQRLGKAAAGRPSESPANRASRRAGSKAANRQK